ncbi:MAG TPA: hypothetical protein VM846_06460 [Vicinamibacterales bacterium]|nr:hypothetical protein [Vicinamibacterales bacterium]
MPTQDRVRRDERCELPQQPASKALAQHRESSALTVSSNRTRRRPSCVLSARFSSRTKAITSRCSRSSHPSSAASNISNGLTDKLYAMPEVGAVFGQYGYALATNIVLYALTH